ncbi:helix-turn-helix transcriptional regulator [Acidaminobacter sp. JC074]|uniref:AraC family transcriptional regulator n=1 Tax=Acidaminobacter sp. JC074 TaxID=2530199 RepID=UPI001F1039B3|nr:AraC family transcriptional regulator [Acidaminobacter sp. JC074]MCH4890138.1 helix-turn-helix transcriptional regulator [Acidaminobacter sp. JC074]
MYIAFSCPPFPHFIVAGSAKYGVQNSHPNRKNVGIFDLIVVESGELYIQEEQKKYVLKKNQYILLMPDTIHIGYKNSCPDTRFYWLHFDTMGDYSTGIDPKHFKPFGTMELSDFKKFNPSMINIKKTDTLTNVLADEVFRYMKELASLNLDLRNNTMNITDSKMPQLLQQNLFNNLMNVLSAKEKTVSLVSNVISYIEANFKNQFTFSEMAKTLNYHPNYIARLMRDQTGYSPMQYLMYYRLNYSKQLLANTNLTVGQIGMESGFTATAYFSKVFKEKTNMLPTEYRLKMRNTIE